MENHYASSSSKSKLHSSCSVNECKYQRMKLDCPSTSRILPKSFLNLLNDVMEITLVKFPQFEVSFRVNNAYNREFPNSNVNCRKSTNCSRFRSYNKQFVELY